MTNPEQDSTAAEILSMCSAEKSSLLSDIIYNQFDRENNLVSGLTFAENYVVIGLGGIGGHVAEILSTFFATKNIVLFDDDIIELTNLNRSVYTNQHIGMLKVEAMAQIISSRNLGVNVIPFPQKFCEQTIVESVSRSREISNMIFNSSLVRVFDCRDNDYQDYNLLLNFSSHTTKDMFEVWRLAYNGMTVTIDPKPTLHPVHGVGGYTQIPSHSIPSRLVALLGILISCVRRKIYKDMIDAITFNVDQLSEALNIVSSLTRQKEFNPQSYNDKLRQIHEIIDQN